MSSIFGPVEDLVQVVVEDRIDLSGPAQRLSDALHVLDAHRDDPEDFVGPVVSMLAHRFHHSGDLVGHGLFLVDPARHEGHQLVRDDLGWAVSAPGKVVSDQS